MPTYVYKFIDSGETIEVVQTFDENTLTELAHPSDGVVRPVKKVFQPVGVTFKGSGFYKTDSRGGAPKSAATVPATADSSASTSSDGSSSNSASSSESSSTNGSSTPATPAAKPATKESAASSSTPSASTSSTSTPSSN